MLYETVKAVDVFDLLRSGIDSSEGKKCCVSRAYAVCWVTPNFWESARIAEKKVYIDCLFISFLGNATCCRQIGYGN